MLERRLLELVQRERRFLPGESSRSQLQDTSIVEDKLSSKGNTLVAGMYQTLSSGSKLSPCSKYWPWTRRLCHSYIVHQSRLAAPYLLRRLTAPYILKTLAAPYLLRRLVAPYLRRRLVAPYLLRILATLYLPRRLATPYLMRRLAASYLLRRHYSLVIAYGPEVAFVTSAIQVDRFNMK
nr:hypothetical protein [Tanacetum cinerariifolium]